MPKKLARIGAGVAWLVFRPHRANLLEQYAITAPEPQNALDIFRGEWASRLPGAFASLAAGESELFDDRRITAAIDALGGVEGKRVLELGPLEAGHTYMLEQRGAAAVTAVEANRRAFVKCLIVKELLGLRRAEFLCGDFVEYLRRSSERFDLCLASGVLYHMKDPVELLALICRSVEQTYLWTHYYDAAVLAKKPKLARHFSKSEMREHAGYAHRVYRQEYRAAVFSNRFCGGSAAYSNWLPKEHIVGALEHFGMKVEVLETDLDHPNGPSLSLVAVRA